VEYAGAIRQRTRLDTWLIATRAYYGVSLEMRSVACECKGAIL
jgi:hypothetical protein